MSVAAAIAWGISRGGDDAILAFLCPEARARVEAARGEGDLERRRDEGGLGRVTLDRQRAAALRARVPLHWRHTVDAVLKGNRASTRSGTIVEAFAIRRLTPALELLSHPLMSFLERDGDLVERVQLIGCRGLGVALRELDGRTFLRATRHLAEEERAAATGGRAATVSDDAYRVVRDAWAHFKASEDPRHAVRKLGMYILAFAADSDDDGALHRRVAHAFGVDDRKMFGHLVSIAKRSSRRHCAGEIARWCLEVSP